MQPWAASPQRKDALAWGTSSSLGSSGRAGPGGAHLATRAIDDRRVSDIANTALRIGCQKAPKTSGPCRMPPCPRLGPKGGRAMYDALQLCPAQEKMETGSGTVQEERTGRGGEAR